MPRSVESLTTLVSKRIDGEIVTKITHVHQDGSESTRFTSAPDMELSLEVEEDRGHEMVLARR